MAVWRRRGDGCVVRGVRLRCGSTPEAVARKAHEPQRLLVCARSWQRYKTLQRAEFGPRPPQQARDRTEKPQQNDSPLGPSVLPAAS